MKQLKDILLEKLIINKDVDFNPRNHEGPISAMIEQFVEWLEKEYNLTDKDKKTVITEVCKYISLEKDEFDLIYYNSKIKLSHNAKIHKHLRNPVVDKYIDSFNPNSDNEFNKLLRKIFENSICKIYLNDIDPGGGSVRYWMLFITDSEDNIEFSYFIDIFL